LRRLGAFTDCTGNAFDVEAMLNLYDITDVRVSVDIARESFENMGISVDSPLASFP
jgi:hypothetical protein